MKQSFLLTRARRLSCLLMLALPVVVAQAQSLVLDESFGAFDPVAQQCPALPTGWTQFNADGQVVDSSQFTWPAGNPGWANWTVNHELLFRPPQYAENCAPLSSARFVPWDGVQADRWLVTPPITVPAGARLRFRAGGADAYEVRWSGVNTSPAAMLADGGAAVLLSVPGETRDTEMSTREVDLAALAGQTGYLAFRNRQVNGFFLTVDDVWVGVPGSDEYPITTVVTPVDGSGGELVCPSGVAPGGSTTCTAFSKPGYTFHHQLGIGGCDQPGDELDTNNDRCDLGNVQGPRTLSATFVPYMPPPTNITAAPDGAGSVRIGWTPPDTSLYVWLYQVGLFPLPHGSAAPLTAACPDQAPFPGPYHVTGCTLPGYRSGIAYVLSLSVTDGWGFRGHSAELTSQQIVQIATVDLPGGAQATLRSYGGAGSTCQLSGAPGVSAPDAAALAAEGAPAGATAPLGVLRVQATGCAGQTIQVAIDYPAGSLAGRQAFARTGAQWQAQGAIGGDTVTYSLSGDGAGAIDALVAPLAGVAAPGGAQPIPTLAAPALVLLSALLGVLALRRRV